MQAIKGSGGMVEVGISLFRSEGIRGLYRGGLPLLIGGGLMRSAQFGVYENILNRLHKLTGGAISPADRLFGLVDWQVVTAGFAGGIGRGVVESPFENIKVRRQVNSNFEIRELFKGSFTTIFRNSILFSLFVIYMDISKSVYGGFSPFVTGSVCATAAWLSIWPLDVVKSQIQSGSFKGKSMKDLLILSYRSGDLYRGIAPGLIRSAIANGLSMMIYKKVEFFLKNSK